ncbi:MAG TPA: D-2-hydroxyacid dehydrogenase [Clostridiaceae bacterium]|jgi:phosphoglycerate dehydrogenase-like enzyme|nr:D-2-hydroxyacid dehydrogenase [Clostridiaceae bacterium]
MAKDVCLLLYDVSDEAVRELADIAPDMDIVRGSRGVIPDESVLKRVKVVYNHASKPFLALLSVPEAKPDWLQLRSAGYDDIDTDAIRAKGITVTNVRGIHGTQMSESLFGILLGRKRALFEAVRNQERAVWHHSDQSGEITGMTMTIVGAGAIGRQIARVATAAFGMTVIGVSRRGQRAPSFARMYKTADWTDAVRDADIVLNLLPLNTGTHHFFDAGAFRSFKRGAWFVNFGRGATVDTNALLAALEDGQLEFAALDVFEQEPLPADSPLWGRDDVLVTPHIAGVSAFYEERSFALFKANLAAYVKTGKPSQNVIDFP